MLTALGEDIDRIVGMEVGADDYLAKPFNPRELLGAHRAVLRRAVHAPRDPLPTKFAPIDSPAGGSMSRRRTLTHDNGTTASLTGAEFRLLAILLAHPHARAERVATRRTDARSRHRSLRSQHRRAHQPTAADPR